MSVGLSEGLALTREELRKEVAFFLGYGRDSTKWSAGQLDLINSCVTKGLRQFYAPRPLPGDNGVMHKWSFLEPTSTVTLYPDYAVGAATVTFQSYDATNDATTIFSSTTTFVSSMVGATMTLTSVTGSFTIRAVNSTTQAVLGGNVSFAGAKTFTIASGGRFALAPYVAGVLGSMWHASTTGYREVKVIPYPEIDSFLAMNDNPTGYAMSVGIKPYIDQGKWRQQVWYAVPYPLPDTQHVLTFKARTTTIAESDDNPFILGAVQHADTIIASCLAAAELRVEGAAGGQTADFGDRLMASVSLDRQLNAQDVVAVLHDPGMRSGPDDAEYVANYDVYVGGVQY